MLNKLNELNSKEYEFNIFTMIDVLLILFVFGGLFGFIYEEIFYRIDLGYFVKRGTTFGPWIPIYGFGAMFIVLSTERIKKHPVLVFFIAAVVSGVLEFATGYFLFNRYGVRLWDYNVEIWNWGNVGGYICARSVLFFGVSALFLQYVVHPIVKYWAYRMKTQWLKAIAIVPSFLFLTDMSTNLLLALFKIH